METEDLIKQLELLDNKLNTITDFYVDNLWERSLIHIVIEKLENNELEIKQLYERIAHLNGEYYE